MKIRRHLVQTIVRAAATVRTDPVLLMAVADKESSFVTAVQAKTSSATGLSRDADMLAPRLRSRAISAACRSTSSA